MFLVYQPDKLFVFSLSTEGWTSPEETRGRAVGGGGRCVTAAQRDCRGAVQETSPQECAQEEAGGGEEVPGRVTGG